MLKGRIRRVMSLALIAAMLLVGMNVSPAVAAASYTGGAGAGTDSAPIYMPNDHTAVGIRYYAPPGSGLATSTAYYVKVRFTVGTTPSPDTNRGYTWNPTTQRWVQERDSWLDFPQVTTGADGSITQDWIFAKFGDEMASGDYHIMVSLSQTGSGTTYNPSALPVVHVIDMATEGAWVHNGVATGRAVDSRIELSDPSSSTICWSLSRTETNVIDDDSNGLVDDEDYGPAGASGDYRLYAPSPGTFDVRFKRSTVVSNDATSGPVDTDKAIGAVEMVPPTAATNLAATGQSGSIDLAWDAATDDGGSGLAGYTVYKWEVPTLAQPFTPLKMPVASLGSTATAWTDTDVMTGVEYAYEVRANDVATNVGPRSNTASAIPIGLGETNRVSGDDRYLTAIESSRANFADGSVTTVVVATGKNFADALSASGLAGTFGSPILLVRDTVTPELKAELDRLGATDVYLVGGPSVVPNAVKSALEASYTVMPVWGADRYETAADVASEIAASGGTTETAFIARGDNFADALAAAPYAWSQRMPVLLVKTTGVPASTGAALTELGTTDGIVVGGLTAVPASVYSALDGALPGTLDRWAGLTRYETAAVVADNAVLNGWASWNYVGLTTGSNFPDALSGGAATGANGGVMLLTTPTVLAPAAEDAMTANVDLIDMVEIFGGTSAVSQDVFDAVQALFP